MSYFHLEAVAPGVYAAIVTPGTGAWGNSGIVDLGDTTLIFDTFATPAAAEALRAEAERLTGNPVRYVINSHEHADHVSGNQVFPGAAIIATSKTRDVMAVRRPAFLKQAQEHPEYVESLAEQARQESDPARRKELEVQVGDFRAIVAAAPTMRVVLPTVTFESRLLLHGSKRTVELISHGGGHTPSDAFLYLPAERLAFMGDLVQVGFHPFISHGDPEVWSRTLEEVERLDLARVIPGHGDVATASAVVSMRTYIADLQALVRQVAADGGSAADVAALPIPQAYRDWECPSVYGTNLSFLFGRRSAE